MVKVDSSQQILTRLRDFWIWLPLRVRNFRLLFLGQSVSLIGDQFYLIALTWLVFQLTGSSLMLGTVLLAGTAPRIVFILVGGAASDWISPHEMMVVSSISRTLVCAILTMLVWTRTITLWQLCLLAGLFGILDAFFSPAVKAFVPSLLDARALQAGNSLMQSVDMLAKFVAPSLAGMVVAIAGTAFAFGLDTISFVVVTLCLLFMKRDSGIASTRKHMTRGAFFRSIKEGLSYTLREPALRSLVMIVAVIEFAFAGPLTVGLASLAHSKFAGGSKALGIMLSTLGGGFLIGTMLAGVVKMSRLGLAIFTAAFILGTNLILLGFAPNLLWSCGLLAIISIIGGGMQVFTMVWLQTRSQAHVRGRVMSVVMLFAFGLTPLSYLASGALSKISLTLMFVVNGALLLIAAAACLLTARQIDQAQRFDPAIGEA